MWPYGTGIRRRPARNKRCVPMIKKLFTSEGPGTGLVDKAVRLSGLTFKGEVRTLTYEDLHQLAADLIERALQARGPHDELFGERPDSAVVTPVSVRPSLLAARHQGPASRPRPSTAGPTRVVSTTTTAGPAYMRARMLIVIPGRGSRGVGCRRTGAARSLGSPAIRRTGWRPEVARSSSGRDITAAAVSSSRAVMSRTARPGSDTCTSSMLSMSDATPLASARFAGGMHATCMSGLCRGGSL